MENFQSHHATSILEQWKNMQSSISMIETSMQNRVNELESKEREIAETAKSVENSRIEVELREKSLDEKLKEVENRQKQTSEKFEAFEVKLQQFEFLCKSLKLKCRKSVEDMKVKEMKLDEIGKELDCRERKIDEKSQILESKTKEIDERRKNLELKENEVLILELKAKESIDEMKATLLEEMKVKESEFSERCQALEAREKQMNERCRALDYREQQINKKCQGLELKTKEFDERCKQQELKEKELNEILQSQKLKTKQRKACLGFPTRAQPKTKEPQPEACSKIQLLCKSMDAKGMKSYLMEHCKDSYLYWLLGLKNKIPSIIQSLIMREEWLRAVVYVCAFKMEEAFPPIPILRAHLECNQKRVQELVKKGTVSAQNDAVNMELSALNAVLNCILNFKLESSFSPAPLQSRIKELRDRQLSQLKEKEIHRHDNVEELGEWDVHVKNLESKTKKMNDQVQGWRKNEVHEPCSILELKDKQLSDTGSMEMESEPYSHMGIEQELRDRQLSELKEKEIHRHDNAEELGEWDVLIKTLELKMKQMNEGFQVQGWKKNKIHEPCRTLELKEKQLNNTGGFSRHGKAEELGEWDVHVTTLGFKKKQMNKCFQLHGWKKNEFHGPWRTSELKEKKLSDTSVLEMKSEPYCNFGMAQEWRDRQLSELKERESSGHDNAEELGEWDVHIKNLESKKKQMNECFQVQVWRRKEVHEPWSTLELKEKKLSDTSGISRHDNAEKLGEWDVHVKTLGSEKKQMNECFQVQGWRKNGVHEPWRTLELKEKQLSDTSGISRHENAEELGEWDVHVKTLGFKKKRMNEHFQVEGWRNNEVHEPCRGSELKGRQSKMSSSGELWNSDTTQIACGLDSFLLKNGFQTDDICRNMDADGLRLYIIEREKELKALHGHQWQLSELKEKGFSGHDNAEEMGEWDVHIKTLESKKKQMNECFGIGRQNSAEKLGEWDVHIKTLESKKKQMNKCFGFGRKNTAEELGEWDVHVKTLGFKKKQMNERFQVHGWRKNEAHEPVALLEASKGILCNNKKRRTR